MFDDLHGIDAVVRGFWISAFLLLIVNPVLVILATRWLQRVARRRGSSGSWMRSFAIVLAIDAAVIAVVVVVLVER